MSEMKPAEEGAKVVSDADKTAHVVNLAPSEEEIMELEKDLKYVEIEVLFPGKCDEDHLGRSRTPRVTCVAWNRREAVSEYRRHGASPL
jgi:hypothetical protein